MKPTVPARNPKGSRTGFTTGACSAAAAKAATRLLVRGETHLEAIESTLPNRQKVAFTLARCEVDGGRARCGIIKDAGDDPDCTHGAELIAEVELTDEAGVDLRGGEGVAEVTKPGLGLEVGAPAINAVPRRNITDMVLEELSASDVVRGARVTIHVPGGEKMAEETLNPRLGLLGGISILGTTGIVRPYSTSAFRASVVQAVDVARTLGHSDVVLTTGGKSERFAMELLPHLPEECFVQMGDFFGVSLRQCARRGISRAHVVAMIGKLTKMADGQKMTHAAGSKVNLDLLADIAREAGSDEDTCAEIQQATTARRALEVCAEKEAREIAIRLCERAVHHARRHADGPLDVYAYLVDFEGALLGRFPGPNTPANGNGDQRETG